MRNFKRDHLASALSAALICCSTAPIRAEALQLDPYDPGPLIAATGSTGGTVRYIVELTDKPLALYDGSIPGLASIPRKRASTQAGNAVARGRLDVESTQAQAYRSFLGDRQSLALDAIRQRLSRGIAPVAQLAHALNAIVLDLAPQEAAMLVSLPAVKRITLDKSTRLSTDLGPQLVGAPILWGGAGQAAADTIFKNGFEAGSLGEGVVVGVLDTGINSQSPSFSATDGSGYTHINPLGDGNYLGVCASPGEAGWCNSKLIGIYPDTSLASSPYGQDGNGHGSHTASTAAGNRRTAQYYDFNTQISGVAPRSNIVAFAVCTPQGGCYQTTIVAAIDRAVADGVVDVLNFSISGGSNPWTDPTSLAFLSATEAGIFVASAAGNTSAFYPEPIASTVNHVEPWILTAGATTHGGGPASWLLVPSGTNAPPPVPLVIGAYIAELTTPISNVALRVSPTYANAGDGCSPYAEGTFAGAAALLHYTAGCPTATMAANAESAGAQLILIALNNESDSPSGATTATPVFTMRQSRGAALADFANGNPSAQVALPLPTGRLQQQPDCLGDFSLIGPSPYALLKPDIVAPGVNILAAYRNDPDGNSANVVAFSSGTSMASPHVAGSGALLRSIHPDWTPAEVKSALQMTATRSTTTDVDCTSALSNQKQGSGRVQVDAAARAGLVLDESAGRFLAADPALDPGSTSALRADQLNIASIQSDNAITIAYSAGGTAIGSQLSRTIKRTFRSTLEHDQIYALAITGNLPGVTVNPTTLHVPAGDTVDVEVTFDSGAWKGSLEYASAELVLTPTDVASPALHIPVAVRLKPPAGEVVVPGSPPGSVLGNVPASGLDLTLLLSNRNGGGTLHAQFPFHDNGNHETTIIDQQAFGLSYMLSMFDGASIGGGFSWSALQSIDLPGPGRQLKKITVQFLQTGTPLVPVPRSVSYSLYADVNGQPSGAPGDGSEPAWSAVIPEDSGALEWKPARIEGAQQLLAISLDLTNPEVPSTIGLAPGRYWLSVQREANVAAAMLGFDMISGWLGSPQGNGTLPMASVFGLPPASVTGSDPGLAVHVTQQFTCDVSSEDPRYAFGSTSLSAAGGVEIGGQTTLTIHSLGDGGAQQNLCLSTNDPKNPVIPLWIDVSEE